ncbi:hypothetical protein CDIK_3223 [Cucumispora dikerogammari]|nr:hypothetical protein CDIK_3223 [Cucumispora dikerogammari]
MQSYTFILLFNLFGCKYIKASGIEINEDRASIWLGPFLDPLKITESITNELGETITVCRTIIQTLVRFRDDDIEKQFIKEDENNNSGIKIDVNVFRKNKNKEYQQLEDQTLNTKLIVDSESVLFHGINLESEKNLYAVVIHQPYNQLNNKYVEYLKENVDDVIQFTITLKPINKKETIPIILKTKLLKIDMSKDPWKLIEVDSADIGGEESSIAENNEDTGQTTRINTDQEMTGLNDKFNTTNVSQTGHGSVESKTPSVSDKIETEISKQTNGIINPHKGENTQQGARMTEKTLEQTVLPKETKSLSTIALQSKTEESQLAETNFNVTATCKKLESGDKKNEEKKQDITSTCLDTTSSESLKSKSAQFSDTDFPVENNKGDIPISINESIEKSTTKTKPGLCETNKTGFFVNSSPTIENSRLEIETPDLFWDAVGKVLSIVCCFSMIIIIVAVWFMAYGNKYRTVI